MEKPKVANFNWNFLVKACYSFLSVSFFQTVCLDVSQKCSVFISSHSSFYTSSGGRWVPSSFGPKDRVYPPSPPCVFTPSVEGACFLPLCRVGFFSVSFFLPSPLRGVLPCLALSLASGCLTREYYPNAEKEILNQVRQ